MRLSKVAVRRFEDEQRRFGTATAPANFLVIHVIDDILRGVGVTGWSLKWGRKRNARRR